MATSRGWKLRVSATADENALLVAIVQLSGPSGVWHNRGHLPLSTRNQHH